jgi:hypothetical protein
MQCRGQSILLVFAISSHSTGNCYKMYWWSSFSLLHEQAHFVCHRLDVIFLDHLEIHIWLITYILCRLIWKKSSAGLLENLLNWWIQFFICSLCVNLLSPNELVGFHLKHSTVSACFLERKRRYVPFDICVQKPDLNWIGDSDTSVPFVLFVIIV